MFLKDVITFQLPPEVHVYGHNVEKRNNRCWFSKKRHKMLVTKYGLMVSAKKIDLISVKL